jgi:hypothetical protein
MTPPTPEGTTLQKYGGPDPGAVVYRKALDIKYSEHHYIKNPEKMGSGGKILEGLSGHLEVVPSGPGVSMIEHPALEEGLTKAVVKVVMH